MSGNTKRTKAPTNIKSGRKLTTEQVVEAITTAKPRRKSVSKSTESKGGQPDAPPAKRSAGGKPSIYSEAIIDEICSRIAQGEPLRQICRDEHMPHWNTIYNWSNANKEVSGRIAHARELGEEAIAQECLEIADSAKNDWMEIHGQDDAGYKLNGEHVQRSKLRIETRLKLLAKWNPRKWGEKVDLNHGVQPENPLAALVQRIAGTGLPVVKDDDK